MIKILLCVHATKKLLGRQCVLEKLCYRLTRERCCTLVLRLFAELQIYDCIKNNYVLALYPHESVQSILQTTYFLVETIILMFKILHERECTGARWCQFVPECGYLTDSLHRYLLGWCWRDVQASRRLPRRRVRG